MAMVKFKFPSKRIEFLTNFVKQPKSFLDVGTDHGFVAVGVAKKNAKIKVVASDISEKCLQKAIDNANLNKTLNITFCVSDGMQNIKEKSFESCLIAGMGGEEIVKILKNKPADLKIKNFYLQPATKVIYLKQWLIKNHYKIVKDEFLLEKNQYYEILLAKKGSQKENLNFYFGKSNLTKPKKDFVSYVEYNLEKLSKIEGSTKSKEIINQKKLFEEAYRRINK